MNVFFDYEQLLKLISNLYEISGIRANILNFRGRDIGLVTDHAPFCERIHSTEEGRSRCLACDARAVHEYSEQEESGASFRTYRCHAGVCEALMPIRISAGSPSLAYLIYGQFLDDSPIEKQWENTRRTLGWWRGDMEELRQAYFQFGRYTAQEQKAYSEILEALSTYIQYREMVLTTERTDLQRLEIYLDQHYMEKLSLSSISSQLGIGRTKLCALAKELSGGGTLVGLLTQKRIDAAKTLLWQSDRSIAAVAEEVGINDYNYFSKVFRANTGSTPSAYRKSCRRAEKKVPAEALNN